MVYKRNKNKKYEDNKKEGIGIVSIIIIVIIAVLGLYYFMSPRSHNNGKEIETIKVPLEAPSPIPDSK